MTREDLINAVIEAMMELGFESFDDVPINVDQSSEE